jgi:3-oxoacyl-[acyl-carrier protein] reductase
MSHNQSHIVISGGSRGLGLALATGLLDDGYAVSTCSRTRTPEVKKFETAYPDSFSWHACSVENAGEAQGFLDEARKRFAAVPFYGLINNAGIARDGILATLPAVDIDKLAGVNLLGALYLARGAARLFVGARSGGRILNISSIVGLRGYKGLAAYAATKAGMDGMTRALARELGPRSVTVNSVAPGYLVTEMSASLSEAQRKQIVNRTPLGRLGECADVLPVVRFLLSEGAQFITGQTIVVDGGICC